MKTLFESPKALIKNITLTILGTLLLSIATSLFILPYDLVVGGMSGLAILFNAALPLGKELWVTIVTISLYLLGLLFLSKDFALKTLVSTVVYPAGVALFSWLASPDVLNGIFYLPGSNYGGIDILLAALFGGIFTGAGCAITFLGGGSTGGVDVLAFIICKYFKKAKQSYILFAIDAVIVVVALFVLHDLVLILLGIICAFVTALVIDKIFLGENRAFIAHVISNASEQINKEIIEDIDRTTTVITARGGYSGKEYEMLMVTFTINQYADLMNIINRNDKNAFVTIHPAHEINGEGFSK